MALLNLARPFCILAEVFHFKLIDEGQAAIAYGLFEGAEILVSPCCSPFLDPRNFSSTRIP